jgi:demethoxyubiquinone hydroxylase (CLK1/Coq7/Cat5 family)
LSNLSGKSVVYFDGACPLCSREIAHYRAQSGASTLVWVDAAQCEPSALGLNLSRDAALGRLHARRADGSLVSGVAAFAIIWSRLPKYQWLANFVSRRPVLPIADCAYSGFLRIRAMWRRPACQSNMLPSEVVSDLRTDHAGEVGAVQIYRGILAVARDRELRAFAERHLVTELRHLRQIERWLPASARSHLLPLWRVTGWATGALPSFFGKRAVFVTIAAVERFVDEHYRAQIERLSAHPELQVLRQTLSGCRSDEIAHCEDAVARLSSPQGVLARVWSAVIDRGSRLAVAASSRI